MTISDSLPIQFWPPTETPFNDAVICGVYSDCFLEYVKFGQELYLQFQHDSALTLRIYHNGNQIYSESMEDLGDDYCGLSIVPNVAINDDLIKVFTIKIFAGSSEVATFGLPSGAIWNDSGTLKIVP